MTENQENVLNAIRKGIHRFSNLIDYCECLTYREIDQSLQSLRRSGVIRYSHKTGWEIVP